MSPVADALAARGLQLTDERRMAARWLVMGAIAGAVASGWGWSYPWGRLVRGVVMTGLVESALNADAIGDDGRSIGVLQFNEVRADLLTRRDWRRSPFWSGYAVARYLRAVGARVATQRPGIQGLAAWRSAWIRGEVLDPEDVRDVGPMAILVWNEIGGRYWWITALQIAAFVGLVLVLPVLAIPIAIVTAIGWAR